MKQIKTIIFIFILTILIVILSGCISNLTAPEITVKEVKLLGMNNKLASTQVHLLIKNTNKKRLVLNSYSMGVYHKNKSVAVLKGNDKLILKPGRNIEHSVMMNIDIQRLLKLSPLLLFEKKINFAIKGHINVSYLIFKRDIHFIDEISINTAQLLKK